MIDGRFIDFNEILSHNLHLNFVDGKREIGKSYGMNRRTLARRIRDGEAIVWARLTLEDAIERAREFGSGKWTELLAREGLTMENVMRNGRRILYRPHKGADWLPLIRYVGLSEWNKMRDGDDPQERLFFFDEFIVPDAKIRRYMGMVGNPVDHLLDMWISLRRGKSRMPILAVGNPELGPDWLTPALGIVDKQVPERIKTYRLRDDVAERLTNDVYKVDRAAVWWTTNPGGQSAGGDASGRPQDVPRGLYARRGGHETPWAYFDLPGGSFSVWLTHGAMICASCGADVPRIRLFPDGDRRTIVLTPQFRRRHLGALADYWRLGRVKFEDAMALSAFQAAVPQIIGTR